MFSLYPYASGLNHVDICISYHHGYIKHALSTLGPIVLCLECLVLKWNEHRCLPIVSFNMGCKGVLTWEALLNTATCPIKNECFAHHQKVRFTYIHQLILPQFPATGVQLVVGHPRDPNVLLPEERSAGGQAGWRQQAWAGEESRRRRRRVVVTGWRGRQQDSVV